MAVLNTDEFKKVLRKISQYSDDDENISIIENLTDTFSNLDKVVEYENRITELEEKIAETDKTWREKYISRFYDGEQPQPNKEVGKNEELNEDDKSTTITIDDLFTEIES